MYRPGLSRRAVYPAVYQRRCHPGGPLRRCAEDDSRSPQGGSQPQSNPHHRQRQGPAGSAGTPQGDGAEPGAGSTYCGRLHEKLTADEKHRTAIRPCGAYIDEYMLNTRSIKPRVQLHLKNQKTYHVVHKHS